ncbi:MAG: hypothetical protein HUK20_11160 [Fibrobacter sp.]|nr:hypothetical protein [Fibrobacter sp.]
MGQKLILYASYQTGKNLPGYVCFALKHLAETDFSVVLLTNRRELSQQSLDFLEEYHIKLYMTENRGYDFGMWKRYLKDLANQKGERHSFDRIERLLIINDSIVYFQNKFQEFIDKAERNSADVISLTQNNQVHPHLQSFFMYIKQEALGAFYMHLLETPEQLTFYDVVNKLEIGLSKTFEEAEVQTDALYKISGKKTDIMLFNYSDLIAQGAGFIKRKLLQRRFNFDEKVHFIRMGAYDALNADYHKMILKAGIAEDFGKEWLPQPIDSKKQQIIDAIWEKSFQKIGWPLLRAAIKTKYKILRKELKGDEYK